MTAEDQPSATFARACAVLPHNAEHRTLTCAPARSKKAEISPAANILMLSLGSRRTRRIGMEVCENQIDGSRITSVAIQKPGWFAAIFRHDEVVYYILGLRLPAFMLMPRKR
jgi:hypothetical protein